MKVVAYTHTNSGTGTRMTRIEAVTTTLTLELDSGAKLEITARSGHITLTSGDGADLRMQPRGLNSLYVEPVR